MRRHRNAEPRWMQARFAGTCACGKTVRKDDQILYWAGNVKPVLCCECGEQYERDLATDDFDYLNNSCL